MAYNFPPVGLSGSLRTVHIANFLADAYKVRVIAPSITNTKRILPTVALDPTLLELMSPNVTLDPVQSNPSYLNPFSRWTFLQYSRLFRLRFWPDPLWYRRIERKESLRDCDILLVSVPPFQVLASLTKILPKLNPKTHLVLDYRDPWVSSVRRTIKPGPWRNKHLPIWEKVERTALQRASLVLVTTEEHKHWMQIDYPEIADKVHVIYNGVVDPDRNPTTAFGKNIVYAGSFSQSQNLTAMAQLTHLLPNYTFHFVGKVPSDFATQVSLSNSRLIGYMPRAKLNTLLEQMNFGMASINSGYTAIIPAKIFEYMEANLPIIAIAPPGATQSLVNKEHIGLVADGLHMQQLATDIQDIDAPGHRALVRRIKAIKHQYSRRRQMELLEKHINTYCTLLAK